MYAMIHRAIRAIAASVVGGMSLPLPTMLSWIALLFAARSGEIPSYFFGSTLAKVNRPPMNQYSGWRVGFSLVGQPCQ